MPPKRKGHLPATGALGRGAHARAGGREETEQLAFVAYWPSSLPSNGLSFYMTRVRLVISLTHDQRNTGATSVC